MDVAAEVIKIIAKKVPGEPRELQAGDNLAELGLESLDAVEMIFDLEEKFDIQIPVNANNAKAEFATVGDVVTAVEKIVAEKARPA
jgi:acyl carrier protein